MMVQELEEPAIRDQTRRVVATPEKSGLQVALFTGGGDRPYALGMAHALLDAGMSVEFIGSDELRSPELERREGLRFLNLRGCQNPSASPLKKIQRVLRYYARLLRYSFTAEPKIFHILWNNRLELIDRVVLMLYYKLLRRRVVLTAHNVNRHERDDEDHGVNRLSLKIQYRLSDHIFVHTEAMKRQLCREFAVAEAKVTVIPFGINATVPCTSLTSADARACLGIAPQEKVLLFFGNIAPYKGLEFLVRAFAQISGNSDEYRLLVAGRKKCPEPYWNEVEPELLALGRAAILRIEYIPDEETEVYFKAADVLILPYTHIFQSGVLFLGYNFGLAAVAADVGSLKDEIVDGQTGFVFRPCDAEDLAARIRQYFDSEMYREGEVRRERIRDYAHERYSWSKVAAQTGEVYTSLLQRP